MSTDTPADSPLVAGRYRLDRIVGAGGAAIVHEGCDLDTGERVAVKVYRSDGSGHPTQHHRELKALTSLRHPGLVALLDGGTEPGPDGRTYVVTDLVEGPSLARRLDAGPLSADEVRVLAIGLAEALAHVHAHGFVHRDVKPANILLEHGHKPRLADFGIARALDGTVSPRRVPWRARPPTSPPSRSAARPWTRRSTSSPSGSSSSRPSPGSGSTPARWSSRPPRACTAARSCPRDCRATWPPCSRR